MKGPSEVDAVVAAAPIPAESARIALPPCSKAPTAYRGGKIYYHGTKNSFRVYVRRGDRIEKFVSEIDWTDKQGMKRKWREALALIDNDPRPH